MDEKLKEFKGKYPDIYQAIFDVGAVSGRKEGFAEGEKAGIEKGKEDGRIEGAQTERKRIQLVEEQLIPGHEDLIQELKFDGRTTGEQAAVKILHAEKTLRETIKIQLDQDAPEAAAHAASPNGGDPPKKDFEQLVAEYQDENKVSKGKAISAVAKTYPEKHAEYLNKANKGGK